MFAYDPKRTWGFQLHQLFRYGGCGIGGTMRRREFITLLGGVAVIGTSAARAQQTKMPVIGYLSGWSAGGAPEYLNYFRQGLAETGFVEGRNCRCRDSDLTPDQIVDGFCHLLEPAPPHSGIRLRPPNCVALMPRRRRLQPAVARRSLPVQE